MATYYKWQKNELTYKESDLLIGSSSYTSMLLDKTYPNRYYYQDSKPEIKQDEDGYYYDFSNASYSEVEPSDSFSISTDKYYANNVRASSYVIGARYIENDGDFFIFTNPNSSFYSYNLTHKAGDFIEYVYNTKSNAYPNGGVQDGYYYDQRTTVESPTAPTNLQYPNPITTPTVMLSWDAATSNTSHNVVLYEVSYSINGGSSWVVDNTTGNTTYNFTSMPAGATSIMFRVRAWDMNNQYGNYVTGTQSQVLLAPTLTIPQMVMQGQPITVSWSIIEGASSYTLQRKSSADTDWVQVYSGANTTFSETVGTWTTVQYRVQAVFDGTPGGWAESAAIPVVSASSLVISGTDEDLGVVTNDIPYSISTDTGNQITATIAVNNAVIFSGNVGNSTADVIPVLDLITGEGTIVISATVDASGSPVTATRTWTYEKAAITFSNSGSVAQVTKEGENIYPKVLAEGVRLPGGKTLDQVMGFPAQIYMGSYVGTGTSGAGNPNTLTFPFTPKMVYIGRTNGQTSVVMLPYIWGAQYFQVVQTDSGGEGIRNKVTISGNTMQWAIVDDTPVDAARQLNDGGYIYGFVAIG